MRSCSASMRSRSHSSHRKVAIVSRYSARACSLVPRCTASASTDSSLERVEPARRRREQVRIGHQPRDRSARPACRGRDAAPCAGRRRPVRPARPRTRRARAPRAAARRATRGRRRARALAHGVQPIEAQPGQRIDLEAGADAERERVVELGQRTLQHARCGEQPPRPRPAFARAVARTPPRACSSNGRGPGGNASSHSSNASLGWCRSAETSGRERDRERLRRQRLARDRRHGRDCRPTTQRIRRPAGRGRAAARVASRGSAGDAHRSSGGVPTVVSQHDEDAARRRRPGRTRLRADRASRRSARPHRAGSCRCRRATGRPGCPNSPAAATSLPTTATTSSTAAMPSTFQSANASMSASMPICRKNTGMSR